ncbi:ABC transporter permease subunit [Bacillus sonorensis]|nr:ABC transporter permease subunit [Bacillus sonorensis]
MADAGSTLLLLGTFVRSVFIVFAGVLIAKLIIGEYKNRTITVMFTYPVSRKKLMAAKLLLTAWIDLFDNDRVRTDSCVYFLAAQ